MSNSPYEFNFGNEPENTGPMRSPFGLEGTAPAGEEFRALFEGQSDSVEYEQQHDEVVAYSDAPIALGSKMAWSATSRCIHGDLRTAVRPPNRCIRQHDHSRYWSGIVGSWYARPPCVAVNVEALNQSRPVPVWSSPRCVLIRVFQQNSIDLTRAPFHGEKLARRLQRNASPSNGPRRTHR